MQAPYFINPDIDALAVATGEERTRLVRRIAANVGDEAALRALLGFDPEEFRNFYPDMAPPELSTEDTISTFIDRFSSEKDAAATEVEQIVAAPAIDYTAYLAEDEPDEPGDEPPEEDATSDAISAFLEAVPPKTPRRPRTVDPELSEALLKLMIKNKNYTKALEIINELSLNNPKKSVYFAYQIRFLEKLIQNQNGVLES